MRIHRLFKALACGWAFASVAAVSLAVADDDPRGAAASDPGPHPYTPKIAPASDEATRAIRSFRVPQGLRVELFAAEPLLANPVAFCLDEKGVVYVAETFRLHAGVTDTRGHMNWLDDDLASRTVADRVAMYRKYLGERVRQVLASSTSGCAGSSTATATAAPTRPRSSPTASTTRPPASAPACWPARATSGTPASPGSGSSATTTATAAPIAASCSTRGTACTSASWATTCTACGSGPTAGSISASATAGSTSPRSTVASCPSPTPARSSAATRTAPSWRSSPRGSATRRSWRSTSSATSSPAIITPTAATRRGWVYLVEGGDSGWRIGYQFIAGPVSRGPWNEEKLWYPAFDGQAAYIVPPIANIADGPSGLAYDPGVSLLPEAYRRHFFLVDFRGASGQSGIRSFALRAQGGVVRAGGFPAVPLVGAGDRRRLRARRGPVLLRLGRGLGQAEQGADLPRARPVAAGRPEGSRSPARCWPRGWRLARTTSWPGCWPTRTCGSARRRSSPWPREARPGCALAKGSQGIADPEVTTPSDGQAR